MENNLNYIERLLEFGLEISIAQQMINSMNQTMSNMNIPGSAHTIEREHKMWFVGIDGKSIGPLSETEIIRMLLSKDLNKDSLVWTYGMTSWKPIQDVPAILKLIIQLPPSL